MVPRRALRLLLLRLPPRQRREPLPQAEVGLLELVAERAVAAAALPAERAGPLGEPRLEELQVELRAGLQEELQAAVWPVIRR